MIGQQTTARARRALDRVMRRNPPVDTDALELSESVDALRRRVDRLEDELEGLQDSVHREAQRRDREIAELRRQAEPQEIARSLSEDARKRGL
jgi:vacuolar-type H+-ATPase subunit I/STV1